MQGSTAKRSARIMVAAAFAVAFVLGATLTFALTSAAGELLGLARVSWIAVPALVLLAIVDVFAIAKSTYCPIGWRRQTPRWLMRRTDMRVVALVWGFDTGLVVTTFRVAAVSWAALILTALGIAPAWAGLAHGLGFVVPFLVLILRPRLGRSNVPDDMGLGALLGQRSLLQGMSAVALCASAALLVT